MTAFARISIQWTGSSLIAALEDTPTVRAILAALPVTASANTWGDEVYFELPVTAMLEPNAKQIVDPGTVCFWTEGNSLALPFGRTPISVDEKPKLASRCNLLGKIEGDYSKLRTVRAGTRITLTRE